MSDTILYLGIAVLVTIIILADAFLPTPRQRIELEKVRRGEADCPKCLTIEEVLTEIERGKNDQVSTCRF